MSYADIDRDEYRSAAMHDNRPTRWIAGLPYDADDVPGRADLEDL